MSADLFLQLEKKVLHAVEVIELLRLQIEELEEENIALKAEHEKWRSDLSTMIKRFDDIDNIPSKEESSSQSELFSQVPEEETVY
jgi:FtsZ-binding cell division protein ZapB